MSTRVATRLRLYRRAGSSDCPQGVHQKVARRMILNLSEADIAKVLSYEQLIPAVEKALSAFSAGQVIQPVRNMLTIEEGKRFLGIMPAVAENGMGAKLVCFFPKNAGTTVPTHLAMIALFEPATGQPFAFLDGVSSLRCTPPLFPPRLRSIWHPKILGYSHCWEAEFRRMRICRLFVMSARSRKCGYGVGLRIEHSVLLRCMARRRWILSLRCGTLT